jgi:hypothetical protein
MLKLRVGERRERDTREGTTSVGRMAFVVPATAENNRVIRESP